MTTKNQIQSIIDKYSTQHNQKSFRKDLYKLVQCAKVEENVLILTGPKEIKIQPEKLNQFQSESIEKTILNIVNGNVVDYDKSRLIVEAFKKVGGWHSTQLIPYDNFQHIWSMYEEKQFGVEFDEDRDYQFIRVNEVKKNNETDIAD